LETSIKAIQQQMETGFAVPPRFELGGFKNPFPDEGTSSTSCQIHIEKPIAGLLGSPLKVTGQLMKGGAFPHTWFAEKCEYREIS
jgi:hypothetical protein